MTFELFNESIETCLPTIDDASVDFIFADPPYFLSNDGFSVKSGRAVSVNKGSWDKSSGFANEIQFHAFWIHECLRILKPNGTIAISGTYHSIFKCGYLLQESGTRIINDLVWFKPNGAPALAGRNFTASHETVIWASKSASAKHHFNYPDSKKWPPNKDILKRDGKQMRSVWSIPATPKREKAFGVHPTQKPLELLTRFISLCTQPGDLVLDPFCGSGTTGVAAVANSRRFVGIDSNCEYIELSRKRISAAYEDSQKA